MLRRFELSQVYHPDRAVYATGHELGRPCKDVWFCADDGVDLNGWFFPADGNAARHRLVFLYCHGNAGNITNRLESCRALLATGASVFIFDYRGYGRSRGRPDEAGTYLDAQAAHQWLVKSGYSGNQILVFGESLGGGVGSELCLTRETAGLVLENTFTSLPDIGAEVFPWLPVRALARIKYETCRKLPRLHIPVLIMHSRADRLIGFHHAQRNFALANEPKLLWEIDGSHNEPLAAPAQFREGLGKFLELVEAARTDHAGAGP